jgi:inhibitor of KinA sporulation pathway (predicted exonuclease)
MPPRFVCVLDFEATCDSPVQLSPPEIIEFPSVLLELVNDKYVVKSEFQKFLKPQVNPLLTAFCTELTGITQA